MGLLKFDSERNFESFGEYRYYLEKKWLEVIFVLGYTLLPIFCLLDFVVIPAVVPREDIYDFIYYFIGLRLAVTVLIIIQHIIIRNTNRINKYNVIHAYIFTVLVGGMIALINIDLGGFESPYFPALILLMLGVTLFLPWRALKAGYIGVLVQALYLIPNLIFDQDYSIGLVIGNMAMLGGALTIAMTIGYFKFQLTYSEYESRKQISEINARLSEQDAELQFELDLASGIQGGILPRTPVEFANLRIESYYRSLGKVGGDFFDIIEGENGDITIFIADVSGHGIPASLVTTMAKISLIHGVRENKRSPGKILHSVNESLRRSIATGDYLTAFLLKIDRKNKITFSNAGHCNPFVIRNEERVVEQWQTKGVFLGVFSQEEVPRKLFVELKDRLGAHDRLFLFTDGLTESCNEAMEEFGPDRLKYLLTQTIDMPVDQARLYIIEQWGRFIGDSTPHDDAMFLLIEAK